MMQSAPPRVSILDGHPKQGDFLALSEHQEATPQSFYNSKPVLHACFSGASIALQRRDLYASAELSVLTGAGESLPPASAAAALPDEKLVLHNIDGFVTSEQLLLWCSSSSNTKTLAIPYHAIALHAIQTAPPAHDEAAADGDEPPQEEARRTVYLQLEPSAFTWVRQDGDGDDDEDERDSVELSLIPGVPSSRPSAAAATSNSHGNNVEGEGKDAKGHHSSGSPSESASASGIFEALSRCADLHPDLGALDADDAEEAGGGPEGPGGLGGAGQWITSENAHEFEGLERSDIAVDVDVEVYQQEEDHPLSSARTNSIGEGLGVGAGVTRPRQDDDDDDEEGGMGQREEETKWQRTS